MHGLSGRKGTKGILKSDGLTDKKVEKKRRFFSTLFSWCCFEYLKNDVL